MGPVMLHSTDRIRTTHAGSLARPPELLDLTQVPRPLARVLDCV